MRIIFFLKIFLFTAIAFAQENEILIKGDYVLDINSEWNLNDVAAKKTKPFKAGEKLNIGYNKNVAAWCIFTVTNPSETPINTWICFDNNHLDSIVFYDGNITKLLGDRTTSISPFIETQAFELPLKSKETKKIFVKVKKGISFFEFSYHLASGDELAQESRVKIALVSFFLGIIFVLVLFNSILFYISRNKMYLYYIFYSIFSAVYIMISSYYAKFFLFPDFIYFSELRIYIASLWLISLSVFLCYYINMKQFQPLKYRTVFILNIINITIIIITVFCLIFNKIEHIRFYFTLGYINFISIIILILWSAIANLKIQKSTAIYVLLAFLPQMLWGLGIMLKSFAIIPKNMPEDSLIIICLYEVFLFGYVLTKNYVETFRNNNELMREIISEKENSLQAITQIQIRERRNIANIIHDNFGSKIAYILQLLQLKNLMLANENIKELANEIREISHQILPKSLDEGALTSSLQSQINTWNSGLQTAKIELFSFDFPEKINEIWIYDLYLITTEIINNSLKHGRAKSINIELYNYTDAYLFQFTDDGIGFDTKKTAKGFGLENIEKRIEYYKGTFEINSSKGEGTVIQISILKK